MTIAECTRNGSEKEKPSTQAAVLLWAHELLRQHQAGWPLNVGEILALTASSKSQGYAKLAQIKQAVASGLRPMGRPRVQVSESLQLEVLKQVREFLISHPGVVHQHGTRHQYHLR